MQGLYGGFSKKEIIHIDGAKLPFAAQYVGCEWNTADCRLGCYDFGYRENTIYETENYAIAFFGEAYGIVDDSTNSIEDYPVYKAEELGILISDQGEKSIENLNGAFVAAIYDKKLRN